jgi:hypothetical protein
MNSCESPPLFPGTNALNNLIMIFQAAHEGAEKERWPQNTDVNLESRFMQRRPAQKGFRVCGKPGIGVTSDNELIPWLRPASLW